MEMLIAEGVVIGFCALLQSAIGFAFSLFAVPLMLMVTDRPLPEVVVLVILTSAVQRVMMLAQLHPHIPWRRSFPVMVASAVAMPLGVWLMGQLAQAEKALVRQIIGGIILLVLLIRWQRKTPPKERLQRRWGLIAGALSGVLSGLANIGGPPLVIWVHAQKLSSEALRVMISAISLPQVPIQMALILARFGLGVLPSLGHLAILCVVTAGGNLAGMAAGRRLNHDRLRVVATVLLVLICISAIFGRG